MSLILVLRSPVQFGSVKNTTDSEMTNWAVCWEVYGQAAQKHVHFKRYHLNTESRYSDGLRARQPEFDSRQRQETSHYSIASRVALVRAQLLISLVAGALSSGVKRPGREAFHLPPSSAEVKNGGAMPEYTISLHGVVLH
jgi:hypothetical protein